MTPSSPLQLSTVEHLTMGLFSTNQKLSAACEKYYWIVLFVIIQTWDFYVFIDKQLRNTKDTNGSNF